ncbi:MAG: transcription termination factor Rho [Planctomycetaceae bacterium]|nr:transcription termination factor Rho [Planctomycetaceae bacterium]
MADSKTEASTETQKPKRKRSSKKKTTTKKDVENKDIDIIFDEGDDASEAKPKRKRAAKKKSEPKPIAKEDSNDQPSNSSSDSSESDSEKNMSSENNSSNDDSNDRQDNNRGRRNRGRRRRGGTQNRGGNNRGRNRNNNRGKGRQRRANVEPSDTEIIGPYEGVLEMHPKGYGFLRDASANYGAQESDPFVSSSLIEKYGLREGVKINGEVGPGSRGQGPRLKTVEKIDDRTPEEYEQIKSFDELTAISPNEQVKLETGPKPITTRVIDLLTPIGKGQRALIVAPPRTGKTMLLQDMAHAISINHPEIHLMVLLIDERPEEVTEMRRNVKGEVIASSMDRDVESHVRISQLIFERGKRLAESGKDVLILLDSITRTARAFNKWVGNSGRTQTGGLDIRALDIPKKLFGTARRFEEGGSLTVVGTALIDTGSRADDAIFQEFKGTGNMELVLNRDLADRRIWPAIDISLSGTRREELILSPETLEGATMLRRSLVSMSPVEAMEQLTKILQKYPNNTEFLERVKAIL